MCLIAYHPPGVMPDEEALLAGAAVNPHGHGWAIWTGPGEFEYGYYDPQEGDVATLGFTEFRERYPDGPAVFHSREATAGRLIAANLQPFQVKLLDGTGVMAHNGHFEDLVPELPDEEGWSDSRLFARRNVENRPLTSLRLLALDEYMEKYHSRAVLITAPGRVHFLGYWDPENTRNGVIYSNTDFVIPPVSEGNPRHHVHLAYRALAEQYRDGDAEAGQRMAALRPLLQGMGE